MTWEGRHVTLTGGVRNGYALLLRESVGMDHTEEAEVNSKIILSLDKGAFGRIFD
jgi:hypothetical protein